MSVTQPTLLHRVQQHLEFIYEDVLLVDSKQMIAKNLINIMQLNLECDAEIKCDSLWDAHDIVLITYGDSLMSQLPLDQDLFKEGDDDKPLVVLKTFLDKYVSGVINTVHILPFFPYSSDDGFAVIDYASINPSLGDWEDVSAIAKDYSLMADLVINHCSSRSFWFQNFIKQQDPGSDYFTTVDQEFDVSNVVRPRTSPLLRTVTRPDGDVDVWCTFSHDQVDFDFSNPKVLMEFTKIIKNFLDKGIRIFRLDAVGFIWKKSGTTCLNLEQAHEIVRLIRTLIECVAPQAILITETNVPMRENLAYFGNANEAHCIYNFSLPPLLVNAMITGSCLALKQWMMSLPPAQLGTAYFNFIASHDGIGLRPAEGLLSDEKITEMIGVMEEFGGRVSYRNLANGVPKPYEINISLFDALQGTVKGKDEYGLERFICAHAIMLAFEGIPGIYIHSLLGTRNDYEKMENCGHNRAINRHRWQYRRLEQYLDSIESHHSIVYNRMRQLITLRINQPAFHPNATQYALHLGDHIFGFSRQSIERTQNIFCIYNISDQAQTLILADINLASTETWIDLISGEEIQDMGETLNLHPYQSVWISNLN